MSNRVIYTIMAVVVIAAVIGVYVMAQGSAEEPPVTVDKPKPTGTGFAGPGHGPATSPSLPPAPGSGSAAPDDLPPRVKEYAANGAIIRDHRSGTHAPIDLDPSATPANTHKLQPTLTKAVADRVREVMHACVVHLPASARGSNPRLEGTINIAIKAKQVSINKAAINVRDVNGEAAEATRQCIEQNSLTITQPAGDEEDLSSYDITLSFALI